MADTTLEPRAPRMLSVPEIRADRERSEFINGGWIEKPTGTLDHSEIERRVVALLRRDYLRVGRPVHELTIRLGVDILIPDVVVLDRKSGTPLLCIEVRSPGQSIGVLVAKCERYADCGVPDCWIIDPQGQCLQFSRTGGFSVAVGGLMKAGPIEIQVEEVLRDDDEV